MVISKISSQEVQQGLHYPTVLSAVTEWNFIPETIRDLDTHRLCLGLV